jgi:hypothetical protein
MKKNYTTKNRITKMPASIAGQVAMNLNLITKLSLVVMESDRVQRRFRSVVLLRLANIDTMAQMIHGAQIADAHLAKWPYSKEKIAEHTKSADEFITRKSNELGLAMVNYIYGDSATDAQLKARTKRVRGSSWSSWEI